MKIDLYDPENFAAGHPLEQYRWLRENDPVHWHEEPNGPGYWAITRYKDVWDIDRNFQSFSSEPTIMIQDSSDQSTNMGGYKMMLMMDPPQHTAYRRLIRNEFTVPVTQERIPRMQALARQIVNEVIEKGECDFVGEVAGEMPSYVIAEMMGLPLDDGRELYKLTEAIHTTAGVGKVNEAGIAAVFKMFEYGRGVIEEKRARPKDDLATKLLQAEVDGKRLDDMEFLLFFLLLIDAGGDTTRNLLSSGMIALLENPDQLAWLNANLPSRLASSREELLRWCSPVVYMRRRATRDIEVAGKKIKEGQKAVMYFGSANRDREKFDQPDTLDLTRSPNEHIAFGTGPHGCLGQHIARIEIDAILTEVLTRMRGFELAATPEWLPSNFISGPRKMPVQFKPAPRLAVN
jgi:cytochrome P450